MTPEFKTIGVVRFSFMSESFYTDRFKTLDELAAYLFSPDRMALRFHFFENLCLPSLARQTDTDFRALIVTSRALPEIYRSKLQALVKPYPHIRERPVGTGPHYSVLKAAYNSMDMGSATHRIMFRLDDDDAMDLNMIKRTKRIAAGLFHLGGEVPPTIIAHNRGFYVKRGEGENEVFDAVARAPLSTGVPLVAPKDHGTNPYRYVHRKYAQHYNTYSDIKVPGFIRTIHGDNKSNPSIFGLSHKMQPGHIAREIEEHFGTTMAALRAL